MFCGWVFFLISLGGQAPHVRPMWALSTCGEPNEIEFTAAHGLCYRSSAGLYRIVASCGGYVIRYPSSVIRYLLSGIQHSASGIFQGAVMFVGWVFYLMSLGGQAPHALRAHMGVHRTCGEPNEIDLTATNPSLNGLPLRRRYSTSIPYGEMCLFVSNDTMRTWVRVTSRSISPHGGQFDFVWPPARTMHPHGAYAWCLTA